jgi:hypothetical protein
MEQVYQKLVDVYNGEGWLSQDGILLTTSIAETTPFADSGYCSPELAEVCAVRVCRFGCVTHAVHICVLHDRLHVYTLLPHCSVPGMDARTVHATTAHSACASAPRWCYA